MEVSGLNVYKELGFFYKLIPLLQRSRILPYDAIIPLRLLNIRRERPDIERAFDIEQRSGRENLIIWYLRHGFVELGLNPSPTDAALINSLGRAAPAIPNLSFTPITWLMRLLRDKFAAPDGFSFQRAESQDQFLSWFFVQALESENLTGFLTPEQANALIAPVGECETRKLKGGRLLHCIWVSSPDLHTHFTGYLDPAFQNWCLSEQGLRRFPILTHPLIALAEPPARNPLHKRAFGVNLFGHVHARSGVSEDVRMACRTLEAAQIAYNVYNISPGAGMAEEDCSVAENSGPLPYAINMFCMTAASTVTAVLSRGRAAVAEHYSIGFWPWELPEMPVFWNHAYDFVDEIWSSTHFTYEAFCRSSPQPVRHVPFAVDVSESDGLTRKDFGLPLEQFLFGFAFDGLSGYARKAPLNIVEAFYRAFARDDHSVGLVIKGLRVGGDPAWQDVIDAVNDDPRIHLVTSSLSRGSLLDLWRALDCFVSLHRSEGFGRNIAEAMLLGRPVIVTAHSGNMDFTDHDTAGLVACSLRPVANGEYAFGEGQSWAEPDISVAASRMHRMFHDHIWRKNLALNGQRRISETYGLETISKSWKQKLTKIYSEN